jgi:hypothetical protein
MPIYTDVSAESNVKFHATPSAVKFLPRVSQWRLFPFKKT